MEFDTLHLSRRDLLKAAPAGALALLLAACSQREPGPTPTVAMTPTAEPESPQHTARAFLDAWQRGDYSAMYALLSPTTQVTIAEEAFTQRYQGILAEATVYEYASTVISAGITGPNQGATDFETTYKTRLVGDVTVRPRMEMTLVDGQWRINWTPALIVPELGTENRMRMFPRTSTRGIIYDRNGEIFATEGTIVSLGVVPGQIEDEGQVLAILSETLGRPPDEIRREYDGQPADWFVPIGEIPFDTAQGRYDQLVSTPGVALRERAIRSYPYQHTASHVIGYVAPISAEELTAFGERGYEETDRVGKIGVEKYAEEILAGKKGGRLAILTPDGQEVATLADVPAVQSRSLNLTLDFPLHLRCEQILGERLGSICVLDVATSRVLALTSWPRFDPNAMSNELSTEQRQVTASQPGQPLLNRATQGLYPPGSVFKVITMATALERGRMGLESAFDCPGFWEKLNIHMACWKEGGHGHIDLYQSLVQSCDVAFYEVGYALYKSGQERNEEILSEFSRAFGLGRATGIELDESDALVPDNAWKLGQLGEGWTPGDTVNMAIGQGFLLTTPLQVANFIAAVANGGTLRRPTLFLRATDPTGAEPVQEFEPETIARLPVSPERLEAVRRSMADVTTPPMGTASGVFGDFPIKVAGKTGTAQNAGEEPHAWFAAYAPADQPQIAVCAMLENAGEGSAVAAPAVRAVLEHYFQLG